LQIDCCPKHGFWLDKNQDNKILELMNEEKTRIEREFQVENAWSKYINYLRSPSFFEKVKNLFKN